MRPVWLNLVAAGACLAGLSSPLVADDYGTLTGRFVFDGRAPKPEKIDVNKDQAVCGGNGLVDESVTVGPKDGLANVVLWLDDDVKVHPDYADPAKLPPAVMDNAKCRFAPRITTAVAGQTVILKNSDPVAHNMNVSFFSNAPINVLIPANAELKKSFPEGEKRPTEVSCSIHPWMKGFLVLKDNPYAAASGEDGSFTIEKIPAGTYTFILWQEVPGYLKSITVDGKEEKLSRGKFEITIKPGVNDLGDIKVDGSQFK